jgi:hypothetical protein
VSEIRQGREIVNNTKLLQDCVNEGNKFVFTADEVHIPVINLNDLSEKQHKMSPEYTRDVRAFTARYKQTLFRNYAMAALHILSIPRAHVTH